MPLSTSPEKIAAIESHGGRCELIDDPSNINAESLRQAKETAGNFMDQFTFAEPATDWRANNNIAESIFKQMAAEPHPVPRWIVCGAGTGGTTATLGRYVRYRRHATRILCVDPERSVFYDYYRSIRDGRSQASLALSSGSTIEGIGRRVGGAIGTNFVGVVSLAHRMIGVGEKGSIVTILCDSGERYSHSCYDPHWYVRQGIVTGFACCHCSARAQHASPN